MKHANTEIVAERFRSIYEPIMDYIANTIPLQTQLEESGDKLCREKKKAISQMLCNACHFLKDGLAEELVRAAYEKKVDLIVEATKKAEIEAIAKPSIPICRGTKFRPSSPYHIEEEELLLWSGCSQRGPLAREAQARYTELLERYVG